MPNIVLIRIAAAAVLAAAVVAGGVAAAKKGGREIPVYLTGAERLLSGEPLKQPQDRKPFTYPPAFALPQIPLLGLPPTAQKVVWYAFTILALGAAFLIVDRSLRPFVPEGKMWLLWLGAALLAGRHVTAVVENASHDHFVMLPVTAAVALFARGRHRASGAFAGLAAALKATPLLFLLLFVVRRRFAAAAAMLAVAGAVTLVPEVLYPQKDGRPRLLAWIDSYVISHRPGEAGPGTGAGLRNTPLNQGLPGTLHRLLPLEGAARRAAILAAQLAVVAFLALVVRRKEEDDAFVRFGCGSAIVCGMVLLSPMSSKSHFCVLLLPIAFGLAHSLRCGGDRGARILFLALLLFGPLTAKGLVGKELGDRLLRYGTVTACAALSLLLAARGVRFARRRARPSP